MIQDIASTTFTYRVDYMVTRQGYTAVTGQKVIVSAEYGTTFASIPTLVALPRGLKAEEIIVTAVQLIAAS